METIRITIMEIMVDGRSPVGCNAETEQDPDADDPPSPGVIVIVLRGPNKLKLSTNGLKKQAQARHSTAHRTTAQDGRDESNNPKAPCSVRALHMPQ